MLLIGLTGSIATGKSTVSRLLSSPPYNLPVVDADLLARAVVARGTPGLAAIVRRFGATTPGLLLPNGELDRAALGHRVFGDDEAHRADRTALNGIIHPLVRKAMFWAAVKAWLQGHWAVVLDVPLLFEGWLDVFCGAVVVVAVGRETQMGRLRARDKGLSAEDAKRRVESQMGVEEKVGLAKGVYGGRGYVVDNEGSLEDLEREVGRVLVSLRSGRTGWWKWLLWGFPPVTVAVAGWRLLRNYWSRKRHAGRTKPEKARL